jgi:hypothetical protein
MDTVIDTEVWRPIAGSEAEYEVSNHGRIRRHFGSKAPKIIEPVVGSDGYLYTKIYGNSGNSGRFIQPISSLVAAAFLPAPEYTGTMYISFIDGDRTNLRADNLRYKIKTKPPIGRW